MTMTQLTLWGDDEPIKEPSPQHDSLCPPPWSVGKDYPEDPDNCSWCQIINKVRIDESERAGRRIEAVDLYADELPPLSGPYDHTLAQWAQSICADLARGKKPRDIKR